MTGQIDIYKEEPKSLDKVAEKILENLLLGNRFQSEKMLEDIKKYILSMDKENMTGQTDIYEEEPKSLDKVAEKILKNLLLGNRILNGRNLEDIKSAIKIYILSRDKGNLNLKKILRQLLKIYPDITEIAAVNRILFVLQEVGCDGITKEFSMSIKRVFRDIQYEQSRNLGEGRD